MSPDQAAEIRNLLTPIQLVLQFLELGEPIPQGMRADAEEALAGILAKTLIPAGGIRLVARGQDWYASVRLPSGEYSEAVGATPTGALAKLHVEMARGK